MDTATALQKAEELLKPWIEDTQKPFDDRLDITIKAENFLIVIKSLLDAHWGYLSAITGVDRPAENADDGAVEVLYHMCEDAAILTVRVYLPYKNPVIDSVCGLIPSATLYERELIEMYGVTITNTPDTDHLLLPDGWPEGVYPLRKSFTGLNVPLKVNEE
ncbi:MAG: NADH-quinone oxidoreductase subunit C [Anaerolineaceae bacterium]|nr:NADH-quinone oxidoreductase subunit C [Anaerolineaceae bacterium]